MKNSNKSLEQRIEESVAQGLREHIAILEKAAAEAVHRGVRRALGATSSTQRQQRRTTRKGPAPKQARRSAAELAALEEQLHAAICAQPGEKMTAYARAVESTPAKLNRPMCSLRSVGRIRSVGQKGRARYFPTGE